MSGKLILDTFCEVYDLLRPWANDEFWDFSQVTVDADSVYLIGRQQFIENAERIHELAAEGRGRYILSNPHEGSDTLRQHVIHRLGIEDLVLDHRILLIGGGDMPPEWPCLPYDSFLPKLFDYEENIRAAANIDRIFETPAKPFKFLFLNGRHRGHRQQLLHRLGPRLSESLWTNLDAGSGPVQVLPEKYEVERYRTNAVGQESYVKFELFDNDWGEIYLQPEPYVDTYFSLVTETVFDYPYSFRTEKTWKPIGMGHPFIIAANRGYYQDLQNLGFRTFGHIIDESFDLIDNNQDRLERIAQVVEDLCDADLSAFLSAAQETCKYNQQHLAHLRGQVRNNFPERFFQFIRQYE